MIPWFAPPVSRLPFSPDIWALLGLVLLFPLALGLVALRFPPRHAWTVILWGLPLAASTLWLLGRVARGGPFQGSSDVWGVTLEWQLDSLSILLILLTQLLMLASAAYAVGFHRASDLPRRSACRFWPLAGALTGALVLIWIAADLLTLYAGLELMGLSAVALMLLPSKEGAWVAGLRYLLYVLVGSLAWLLGVALLLGAWHHLDLDGLARVVEPGMVTTVAVSLLTAGLLLKAAVFPLHGWLVPVHAAAWVPVSAIHAALVIKASFFILLKLWLMLLPGQVIGAWLLGVLGSLAVLWGGLLAWRATSLKRIVAFSTVGQLGYLLLAFPLMIGTSEAVSMLAWQATWLQLAGHALAKAAMFMAVGNLILASGCRDLLDLAGTSRRLPLSLMTFGLAAVTLMGLPPSAGFTAKWLFLQASLLGGHWPWVGVLMTGSLLTAAYVFRVFRHSYLEVASERTYRSLPAGMDLIAFLLALSAMGLGLLADWPLGLLRSPGGGT
jgi:formate hydrogenlyase subunit 3/multisubunit Na+/H+ antiporter MnhD subunit